MFLTCTKKKKTKKNGNSNVRSYQTTEADYKKRFIKSIKILPKEKKKKSINMVAFDIKNKG